MFKRIIDAVRQKDRIEHLERSLREATLHAIEVEAMVTRLEGMHAVEVARRHLLEAMVNDARAALGEDEEDIDDDALTRDHRS